MSDLESDDEKLGEESDKEDLKINDYAISGSLPFSFCLLNSFPKLCFPISSF
ncbi:hypothetical protein RhiirC2_758559, partial [Rhizophagus irregularis]